MASRKTTASDGLALRPVERAELAFPVADRAEVEDAGTYVVSANTKKAYASDWKGFCAWCESRGVASLPAAVQTVVTYAAVLATNHQVSTVKRHMAAIASAHKFSGYPTPTRAEEVRTVFKGLRRKYRARPVKKKFATDADVLRQMLATLKSQTLRDRRDRAILLLGFACAMRRAELVDLDVADLTFRPDRLDIRIKFSKTDTVGHGTLIGVLPDADPQLCPIKAARTWLLAAGLKEGPLFRGVTKYDTLLGERVNAALVARVVKRAIEDAGLDPTVYGGHSLRAGHITEAARQGAQLHVIQKTSRHKSLAILVGYIRDADTVGGSSAPFVSLSRTSPKEKSCMDCGRPLVLGQVCRCSR